MWPAAQGGQNATQHLDIAVGDLDDTVRWAIAVGVRVEQAPTRQAYRTTVTGDLRIVQALIVVDMQTAFVSGDTAVPRAAGLLMAVTDLMRRAREAGALVVQLQNDGLPGTADEPHTPGWELFLPPAEGDGQLVIRKDTDDGFHKTELSSLLNKRAIRHLAVCGVMSEMCVSATARSALNLGYHVVLPHDGHATYDIPAAEGLADAVPHAMASRVAEWALGDQIDIIARATDVQFQPAPARSVEDLAGPA